MKRKSNKVDPLIQLAKKRQRESLEYAEELKRNGTTHPARSVVREEMERIDRERTFKDMQKIYR